MKLIIQSDDFGITEAVSCGIIKGIREGMITCTGLFSNMPASAFAAELVRPYDVCLGQDINIVAGRPCADPARLTSMVQPDGTFLNAGMHRRLDETAENHDHLIFEECLLEVEAQIRRFIELTGKKPEYLHGHSYGTATLGRAMHEMSAKYEVPITFDLYEQHHVAFWKEKRKSAARFTGKYDTESAAEWTDTDICRQRCKGSKYFQGRAGETGRRGPGA